MIILPGDMYDAIPSLVGNIPTDAYAVAGYVDSISFTWPQSAWDRFPKSLHCTITTTGRLPAHFADVENGDLTPQQGYDLYQAGRIKGIYCNFATWQTVQDIFNANRKPHSPYFIAQYPGGGRAMPVLNGIEAIAHQYYNSNLYDKSAITDMFVELIGGTVTDPVDLNLQGFVWKGGPSVDAINAMADLAPNGVDPKSLFGRIVDVQLALTADLPKLDQILAAISALSGALSTDEAAILAAVAGADADVKAGVAQLATAIAAMPAGQPPTDAQMSALTAAVVKALPGYTVNITPTAA